MSDRAFNPYAAPQATHLHTADPGSIYRREKFLVVPRESAPSLPCESCVKCGRPSAKTLKRVLYWHPPLLYLLLLLNVLIYLIVAVIVRKKLNVTIGLCEDHASARRNWIAGAWLTFFGGIGLFVVAAKVPDGQGWSYGLTGGGMLLLSLIVACIASNVTVRPQRITEKEGTLTGAGEGYLRQFAGV